MSRTTTMLSRRYLPLVFGWCRPFHSLTMLRDVLGVVRVCVGQLTRDCVGGKAKTLFLVNLSPCSRDEDEALRTLKFVHKLKVGWPSFTVAHRSRFVHCVALAVPAKLGFRPPTKEVGQTRPVG